jgi:hypothetical protein
MLENKNILANGMREVRFKVLTAASVMMTVSWYIAPFYLAEVNRRFGSSCSLHHQGDDLQDHCGLYVTYYLLSCIGLC